MEKDKVSIIVAIYNSEKFIRKCIESIVGQTYRNLEIILVDDGSPDRSGEICDEYKNKDKRIKVIHKKNGGACDARNRGLEEVTGKYLTIIDGDDWMAEDYVSYLMNIINRFNVDMAISDNVFTTRDLHQIKRDSLEKVSPEEAVARIIYPIVPIGPWSKMYSSKLIKDNAINFNTPWSGEGLYFSAMAAYHSKAVGIGHRKVYVYRMNNENSGLTKYNIVMGINALDNIKNIKNKICTNNVRLINAINWHIWKNNFYLLKLIVATGNEKKEKELYSECKSYLRRTMVGVAINSDVSLKSKMMIIVKSIFPRMIALCEIRKEQKDLKEDLKNNT